MILYLSKWEKSKGWFYLKATHVPKAKIKHETETLKRSHDATLTWNTATCVWHLGPSKLIICFCFIDCIKIEEKSEHIEFDEDAFLDAIPRHQPSKDLNASDAWWIWNLLSLYATMEVSSNISAAPWPALTRNVTSPALRRICQPI